MNVCPAPCVGRWCVGLCLGFTFEGAVGRCLVGLNIQKLIELCVFFDPKSGLFSIRQAESSKLVVGCWLLAFNAFYA